jgi:hypothetical protein
MKLTKILTAFFALISLQIAASQWLNVPPPAEARNLMVVGGVVPVGGCSNNTSTDFIGYKTAGATSESVPSDTLSLLRYQATSLTCSTGTLETAYLYNRYDGSSHAKICIYTSSDTTPQEADALVGCSSTIFGDTSSTWYSAAADGSYTITKNNYYWVGVYGVTEGWDYRSDGSSSTLYYKDVGASPPATLGVGWSNSSSRGLTSYYFRIQ